MSTTPSDNPYAPPPEGTATASGATGAWQPHSSLRYPLVLTGVRRFAAAMFVFAAVIALASALADAYRLRVVGELLGDPSPSRVSDLLDDADTSDSLVHITAILTVLTALVLAIAFIIWLFRGYRNLRWIGMETRRSPGWAIGGWFIPFANLVIPFSVVADFCRKTDPPGRKPTLAVAWWVAFICGNVLSGIAARQPSDTLEQMQSLTQMDLISDGFRFAAAVLGYALVKQLTQRHDRTMHATVESWRQQWPSMSAPQP